MPNFGYFEVNSDLSHGNTHEYMKNNGNNGKPMADNIGLDTLISCLAPLLVKNVNVLFSIWAQTLI